MAQTRTKKLTHDDFPAIDTVQLLAGLNPEQTEVVKAHLGAYMVLAGAGAGKTRALVNRIGYLIGVHEVNPKEILAVTFSKKAAGEMNDRLRNLGVQGCRVGTWHSLALEILRTERPEFGKHWEVDERDRFPLIVKDVLGYQGMKWDSADLGVVQSFVGLCMAGCAEPRTDAAREIAAKMHADNPCLQTNPELLNEAYARAFDAMTDRKLLTFDAMLLFTWQLLRDDADARARWGARWSFLLQDEAQDSNKVQAEIATYLATGHGNYMIVGDPAQSIYGFRGAQPQRFMAFPTEWAGATVIRMFRNYRSGSSVITAANAVARAMAEGTTLGVDMAAERTESAEIVVQSVQTQDEEGEEVAIKLQGAHADGTKWGEMAVLYRTNAQSRGVEEALLSARIPYVVIGGTNFYDRREVKDLLAYLRLADGRGEERDFERSINTPFRFIGKVTVAAFVGAHRDGETWTDTVLRVLPSAGIQARQKTSAMEWCGLISMVKNRLAKGMAAGASEEDKKAAMPAALLEMIINSTDYMKFLTKDQGQESVENNRVSNVRELVRSAGRFPTVGELLDYIDETLKAAKKAREDRTADRVTLCSLHKSKGLEWPVVCMIGCNEKIIPHGKSKDIEEERRLFYVGVTRAMDYLHISCVRSTAFGSRVVEVEPSRFIAEAQIAVRVAS